MRAIYIFALMFACAMAITPLPKKLQFRKDGTFTVLQVGSLIHNLFLDD